MFPTFCKVYLLVILFNVWSNSNATAIHINRKCIHSKLIRFNLSKLYSNSDDKYVLPPPPVGSKGEWDDWENDNYLEEPANMQEGDGADPFFATGLSDPKVSPSEFEAGWSEEPPYFDEDDQDDYEGNKFSNTNDLTSPNEIMPKISNKVLFASSFTPTATKPIKVSDNKDNVKIPDMQSVSAATLSNNLSIESIRNVVIDQNTILELKLQAMIATSGVAAAKDTSQGSSDINSLRVEMVALSNKLNLALVLLGVSFLVNILALNAS